MPSCSAQKKRKQASSAPVHAEHRQRDPEPAAEEHVEQLVDRLPPIQVWMPNQPQATSARSSDGTCAPSDPNDARASTGNGMPYFVPACR
jgi:hypothetical protein